MRPVHAAIERLQQGCTGLTHYTLEQAPKWTGLIHYTLEQALKCTGLIHYTLEQ